MNPTQYDSVFRVSPDLPRCTLHVWPDAMLSESSSPALRIRHTQIQLGRARCLSGGWHHFRLSAAVHCAREQSKLPYLETGDWRLECQCNRQVLGLVAINSAAFCRYFARLLFSVVHLPLLEPRYNPHLARSTGIVKSGHGVAALATPTVHHVDVRKLVLDGDSELP